jgi:hypothetical protein
MPDCESPVFDICIYMPPSELYRLLGLGVLSGGSIEKVTHRSVPFLVACMSTRLSTTSATMGQPTADK